MLLNVKMPSIDGILTFISMLNVTSESMKARKVGIFQQSSFLWAVEISSSVELSTKKFYNLVAWLFLLFAQA